MAYDWLNYFYMAAVVGIISSHGLETEACRRNQPSKSKVSLYDLLPSLYQFFKTAVHT